MKAFLYSQNGELLHILSVSNDEPSQMLFEFGKQYVLRGSEARILKDEEIEWLGWDYVEHGNQNENFPNKLFSDILLYLLSTVPYSLDNLPDYKQEPYLLIRRIARVLLINKD